MAVKMFLKKEKSTKPECTGSLSTVDFLLSQFPKATQHRLSVLIQSNSTIVSRLPHNMAHGISDLPDYNSKHIKEKLMWVKLHGSAKKMQMGPGITHGLCFSPWEN